MTTTLMVISGFHASSRRHYFFHCCLSLSPYYSRPLHTSYPSHLLLHGYRKMVETTRSRIHGNGNGDGADKTKSPTGAVRECEHRHNQLHTQSHSHDGHDHGGALIETLVQSGGARAWFPSTFFVCIYDGSRVTVLLPYCFLPLREGHGDRGSHVTLVGLGANVLLTSA
jgi:hypothetical protein